MKLFWVLIGGCVGLAVGAVPGFAVALVVASLSGPRTDGTFGMRDMLVCLPLGAILGGLMGAILVFRRSGH